MDIIGELLRTNMLQQVGDDANRVERLRRAADVLADNLASHDRDRLPLALFSAIDSTSHAKAPMLRRSREALLEVWETFGNAFPDEPVELYRAVLLDAAATAFTTDDVTAAAGWYTLRTALQLLQAGRWEPVLRRLLGEWDAKTGTAAEQAWTATPERSDEIQQQPTDGEQEEEEQEEEEQEGKEEGHAKLTSWTRAQAIINAGSGTYNTQFTNALRSNFQAFTNDLSRDMRTIAEAVFRESVKRMEETARTVVRESIRRAEQMERLTRAALRTELLWWRSTGYSSSRRCRYNELTPTQTVIAAALDVHHMVGALSPASTEHILFDTVAAAADGTVTVNELANCAWSADLAKEFEPAEGTLLGAVTLGADTPLASRHARMSPPDAAVILFRDLQAARLLTRRAAQ